MILRWAFLTAWIATSALAAPMDAVVRTHSGAAKVDTVEVPLLDPARAETAEFKVVLGKSNEALDLATATSEMRLRAGTVLYHLRRAREYFAKTLGSEYVSNLPRLTIRLELTNLFNNQGHYANDAKDPQYNNALSVPAGLGRPDKGVEPWNLEIWFRPRKEIPIAEILAQLPEDPVNPAIRQVREVFYPTEIDLGVKNAIHTLFDPSLTGNSFLQSSTRQAGTILLVEAGFQVLKVANRAFVPKQYYIDTAMVPEIIQHEFSHIALSDTVAPTWSRPVNEGMADFFAATMANSPKLAKRIHKFSTAIGKNGKNHEKFELLYESKDKANADFVLGLLWGLRHVFGTELATKLVYDARLDVRTETADIRHDLVDALHGACERVCPAPFYDDLRLHRYLIEKGL